MIVVGSKVTFSESKALVSAKAVASVNDISL